MALEAPVVTWYNGEQYKEEDDTVVPVNTQDMSSWNAGIIDAGSASRPADVNEPDPEYYPCTFLIWNNRGGVTQISSMQSVQISTLSLVRDGEGDVDPNNSYKPEGAVAGSAIDPNKRAHVEAIFYNEVESGWGIYNQAGEWQPNEWGTIEGGIKLDVLSAAGVRNIISGAANTANISDSANYSKVKLRLVVRPDAQAGRVEWYTRVSYNYDGVI